MIYIVSDGVIQPYEVLEFYEICKIHNIPEFEESCNRIIKQKTVEVVESDYFLSVKPETLELILKSPTLQLESEIDVFHHFNRWVMAEAERRGIGIGKIMSGSINHLKKHIRFLTISSNDFLSRVANSLLLTSEEKIAIACNLKTSDSKPIPESLSLERKRRDFTPTSIKPEHYGHKHSFVISIDRLCSSCNEYKLQSNYKNLSMKVTFTKILEYLCFQVEVSTNRTCQSIELMTIESKLEVLAVSDDEDNLVYKAKFRIILDWNTIQQNKIVFAQIPISKLKEDCFKTGDAETVTVVSSFNVIVETPNGTLIY
ncbi:hypothetical protein LSTR_LSTR003827 [Laodelphax striatellus]|uniref:BACK domain-containing protein n=1 Tax=Laodelphax striatellus TaxID=195883 RepID=A0A482XEP3_LAOST|nr:hypothetical protein LSTR_LSTR003827 [Laodelphax striatellus]